MNTRSLLSALVMLLVFGSGCASQSVSSSTSVKPAPYQPGPVKISTSQGYELLSSQAAESTVAVSLRSVTGDYAQFFVSIFRTAGDEAFVSPEQIKVVTKGGPSETFKAYLPEEVPQVVEQDARGDVRFIADLMQVTGDLYASESDESAYEAGAPESDEEAEVLLEPTALGVGDRVSGFVYTPFSLGAGQLIIKVPVGNEMHRFRYMLSDEQE